MPKSRLLWRVYLYFLLATLAALAVSLGLSLRSLSNFHEDQVSSDLEVRAKLAAEDLIHEDIEDPPSIDLFCKRIGNLTDMRVTVVTADGRVIGDSFQDPALMDDHSRRPEVAAALRGETGRASRFSDTTKRTLMYVAIPHEHDGQIDYVVRVSQPLSELEGSRRVIFRQILFGGVGVAVLFACLALYLSRRITQPLEEMRRIADRLADGDLNSRVAVTSTDEVGALARALNRMAAQLGDRMSTIGRQQAEQQAMLTSMVEGVLAVDPNGSVLYLNDAAAELVGSSLHTAQGRSIQEVIRHHELQGFITETLINSEPMEAETVIQGVTERHIQLQGAPLSDSLGGRIGGLIVMNDVTRQKRLESFRSDFVANVSHELKTPITALKGCVETLTGDDPVDPDAESRFMAIMTRHVDRLEAIVQDLLSLSRLEFEVGHDQVQLENGYLADITRRAVQAFEERAGLKGIAIQVDCPEGLQAQINSALMEQAIGNLVDNAVKYSQDNTTVIVAVQEHAEDLLIQVADQGPGIEKKHLPRLFERFYRVDRARSRSLGGTGLGLSIVKHIALAHKGSVSVDSTPGQGSVFTIRIPK